MSCCGHRPAASFLFWCAGEVGGTTTARSETRAHDQWLGQPTTKATAATPSNRFPQFPAKRGRRWTLRSDVAQIIINIAGHVSRAMLSRYSHVRIEAKRHALDEIATRQGTADEKRQKDAKGREQVAAVSQSAVVQ